MNRAVDPAFTLHHRAEILDILNRLHRERVLTTVEFGDGHAIVSSVLEVRRDTNALVFDITRDVEANRHLFAAPKLAFVSELDNIQIAFETKAASLVAFVDGPAAVVDMPNAVVRLQRREWFRATLPVQPPIRCTLLDCKGKASPAQAIDLSCGGTAMMVDDPSLADTDIGTGLELILSLPDVGPIALDATVRTVQSADAIGGKVRLGFRFEKVVPKTANQIQRYVQQLEVHQLRVLRLRG